MTAYLENPILILGSPRSGTTWLAKIFDSHPAVLYRHEPDSELHGEGLPYFPEPGDLPGLLAPAREYIGELAEVRTAKVAGSQPVFAKNYRSPAGGICHQALSVIAKGLDRAGKRAGRSLGPRIPDLTARGGPPPVLVIKSVDSLGRARLFADALPQLNIIHILRHPCAFIASEIRGEALAGMQINTFLATQASLPQAAAHGLTLEALQGLSREQQLASLWMLQNEKVMEEMEGRPNYRRVIYEELCADPVRVSGELFEFCGLPFEQQTEVFLAESLNYSGGDERYFQVVRSPLKAANKWRSELSSEQIKDIESVVKMSRPGRLYRDDFQATSGHQSSQPGASAARSSP